MNLIEETHTELNFSLKISPFTEESITVKREPDDFDNRKSENEVDQDLDQKSTIQIHSHIKSEEDFTNSQCWISHAEVNIKPEEDEEHSDNQFKNDKVMYRPNNQIIYQCPDCCYQSNRKRNLKEHSIRHKKPDEIVWHRCTECPYKTEWKQHLKRHAIVHNEPLQVEMFKCAHCVYETPRKHTLRRHLLRHRVDNISWIHCPEPECPYKTNDKEKLKRHSSVHNNDEFFCPEPECPYKTQDNTNLKRHLSRMHKNDQFFKCSQCPYQAKRQEYLKIHQRKHQSTDKWHACPQCPYKTIIKFNLQKHILRHAKWFRCEHCPYKTTRKDIFKQHAHLPTIWIMPNGYSASPVHLKHGENPSSSDTK